MSVEELDIDPQATDVQNPNNEMLVHPTNDTMCIENNEESQNQKEFESSVRERNDGLSMDSDEERQEVLQLNGTVEDNSSKVVTESVIGDRDGNDVESNGSLNQSPGSNNQHGSVDVTFFTHLSLFPRKRTRESLNENLSPCESVGKKQHHDSSTG